MKEGLSDPDNATTQLILWFYTMEPNCHEDFNMACQDESSKYVETLGPLSCVLYDILQAAEARREDRIKSGNRFHHQSIERTHKLGHFNSSFLLFKGSMIPKSALTQWFHF